MKEAFHGSDIEKIEEKYGVSADEIISFAANVSPLGVSSLYLNGISEKLHCVERYPERDYGRLRDAISSYCGAKSSNIIVGSGSSELISAVIKHHPAPEVMITAPAYAEYARNVAIAGGNSRYYSLKAEEGFEFDINRLIDSLTDELDLLIICNPMNPTGTALKSSELDSVLERCEELDIICAVDETYVDFADDEYDATSLAEVYPCLFIIRSMSKFFSAPGLRIGYGITTNETLLKEIEENKDPWSVSSLSNEAAILMLKDRDYIAESKKYMASERERVCRKLDSLKPLGITYTVPRANFVLLHLPENRLSAKGLFEKAIREKMMIRNCADYSGLENGYVRFCFMKEEDDDRLLSLIKEAYT